MSDLFVFILKLVSGLVVLAYGLIPVLLEHRVTGAGGKARLSKPGRLLIGLAGAGFVLATMADAYKDNKDDQEKAATAASFRARTDRITERQETVLSEITRIRDENVQLRMLQNNALSQIDSVAATGEQLSFLQRRAIRELSYELEFSRSIADSLRNNLRLSREISDTLRASGVEAGVRTQVTLAEIRRRSNPLTSIRGYFGFTFPRTHETGDILDALHARAERGRALMDSFFSDMEVGKDHRSVALPPAIVLYFWHATDCQNSFNINSVEVSAFRRLDYSMVVPKFSVERQTGAIMSLELSWGEDEFEFMNNGEISVADLDDACVFLDIGPHMDPRSADRTFWPTAAIVLNSLVLPHGRTATLLPADYRWDHPTRYRRVHLDR